MHLTNISLLCTQENFKTWNDALIAKDFDKVAALCTRTAPPQAGGRQQGLS